MKSDFNYNLVPANYAFCMNTSCPQSADCLRHQLLLHVPSDIKFIKVVNPTLASPVVGEPCSYYRVDALRQFAVGMNHLFDSLPHKDAVIIKDQLLCYFGHSLFYRYWRGERMFTPAQQKYVQKLFHEQGITSTPVFDKYVERYEW